MTHEQSSTPDSDLPIRVMMVLDSFSFGGAENLVAELGRHASASLDISVASLQPAGQGSNQLLDRLTESGLKPTFLGMRRLLDPVGFMRVVRAIRQAPVDVVHAHLGYAAIVVPIAARLAGKPAVATLHVNPPHRLRGGEWLKERLSIRVPARLGRLVLISQHAREEFAQRHGPARDTWRVIPNGVDTTSYAPRPRAQSVDAPVWACVAAMRPDKNHVGLVRAWAAVVAAHPRATLLIVGDGPSREATEAAIEELGLIANVRMLGRREDVVDILHGVDGVVSASIDEALPTALIEAAACGLPVVAADAGGTREIVIDGVTGRLVPISDDEALTAALLDVIDHPERAEEFGRAGRDLIENRYALSTWVDNLTDLYAEVIAERGKRRYPRRRCAGVAGMTKRDGPGRSCPT
ncbi:glycosyltransferase [Mycobacterium barrassiae]|uniref:glycosyltransferase n=1 Tax=Mycobacterium barrassiae TaxID=319709 RepID=UPI00226589A4|nr:glycosyltransferase [Mycobacterium barrassiae]